MKIRKILKDDLKFLRIALSKAKTNATRDFISGKIAYIEDLLFDNANFEGD